jgi:subtilisin family serine protease
MKSIGTVLSILCIASTLQSFSQEIQSIQTPFIATAPLTLAPELQKKIASGEVLVHLAKKMDDARLHGATAANSYLTVALYTAAAPTSAFISELHSRGVRVAASSWIPPLDHHPLGFMIAQVPTEKFTDVLGIADVQMIETAERESVPLNNLAAVAIKANLAWAAKWTGTGIKVGLLDSGYDDRMPDTELPVPVAKRDYSSYPASIDTTVRNKITGHGTHTAGTLLGRGGWSSVNTINGGGSYKGMAPNASLVFLKIGDDTTSNATDAAIVAAIKAAVDTFSVNEISMSYGGWDAYHDGSDILCQTVDYAYSKGVACFLSAGNSAADGHHVSGTVNANDTSGYIQIDVTGAGRNNTFLEMDLTWLDGGAHKGLRLLYYNAAKTRLTAVTNVAPTTSPRGTESEDSFYNPFLPAGNSTYYVRVLNRSAAVQTYHLYFFGLFSNVVFASPDPNYTIGTPALADHGFAVGAYTTRVNWTASDGLTYHFVDGAVLSDIAFFSSRGPRIDGLLKPNITAPGKAVVSLRDRDVITTTDALWIDNDGISGGPANYYVMEGTSMAAPVCAGAAALVYQHSPSSTPQQIYDALSQNASIDAFTGGVPNFTWGSGKLDVNATITNIPLPVELTAFTATAKNGTVTLSWSTATETDTYGFDVEKKFVVHAVGPTAQGAPGAIPWTRVGFAAGNGTTNNRHDYSFTDQVKDPGAYSYRLKQIDRNGKFSYSPEIEVNPGVVPIAYSLGQNYPNPFNPTTHIQFSIGDDRQVHLVVYDLLGRTVAELMNAPLRAGRYSVEWNAANAASGIYFFRLDAGNFTAVKKLMVQK